MVHPMARPPVGRFEEAKQQFEACYKQVAKIRRQNELLAKPSITEIQESRTVHPAGVRGKFDWNKESIKRQLKGDLREYRYDY